MMQNTEEHCLRRIIEDILEKSSASGSSIVNTNSGNDSNYCPPANNEST
jgi:hypothetical protein